MKEKIDILNTLTTLALKEAELLWTRYTTLLYASTGLVGILSFAIDNESKRIVIGIGVIGIILSFVWIQMIRLSSYYYQRWQMDADYLIKSEEILEEFIKGRTAPRLEPPTKFPASTYGKIIPIIFLIGWLIVLFDTIFGVGLIWI